MSGPDVWGPHGWKFIHYVTLGYPNNPTPEIKNKYKAFFELLSITLPCSICGAHYSEHIQKIPLTEEILNDREKLIKWAIDLHNEVNAMKNKPIVEYKRARRMIDNNEKCRNNIRYFDEYDNEDRQSKTVFKLMAIFIALVVIAIVYKSK